MKIKFKYVLGISALSVSIIGAYFSVWGLSQLFAGASTAVIFMASFLEFAKIIATTALHRYWGNLAKGLRVYLTLSVLVLMMITSAGIYGFLSNSYQKTANKLEIHEGELSVLGGKRGVFEKNISDNEKNIITKNKRIDQLTNLRITQENRLDSAKTSKNKDKVRSDIALATSEIQKLSTDIDGLNIKDAILSDSVSKYNVKALELKSNSEVSGEVGPLKYISALTGVPMDKVVNYLILLLIFVFDPLAVSLILMTNKVFQLEGEVVPLEIKKKITKEVLEVGVDALKEEPIVEELTETPIEVINKEIIPEVILKEEILAPEVIEPLGYKTDERRQTEPPIEETKIVSESNIEVPVYKKEPVVTTGKIAVEDIKEIKENRGYSVPVPQSKGTNTIERIGSNKIVKNGDNNKFFFRRK